MNPEKLITLKLKEAVEALYGEKLQDNFFQTQATRKEFEGDITIVVFPLLKTSKKSPEATAQELGEYIAGNSPEVKAFNVVKGFLNITLSDNFWMNTFKNISESADWGQHPESGKTVMVEYSSPNTNKPLHLGHIRNNLLGWSVATLLEANGHKVVKVNLVNDRGIHICKSMLAWQKRANGETPVSSGMKGDHLVGKYYVIFNEMLKKEIEILVSSGLDKEEAEKQAAILKEAQEMLVRWERGDKDTVDLWKTMNSWVYEGFDKTYKRLGVSFDKTYYESQTYLLGKELVKEGLKKGVFTEKENGSVWCDLTSDGLDEKLLLRADGTSVYMTHDLGTAHQRFAEYTFNELIYVVGNEQNYHFQVLKLILKKLGFNWSDSIYHLSYGMVELPEGKMKSREGTVVDADDLIEDMVNTARETSMELGKLDNMSPEEQNSVFEMLGLGALKYFILKVDPRKTMLFDTKESIDFNGNTGPFIQYTHARIKSVLRKANSAEMEIPQAINTNLPFSQKEIDLIKMIDLYTETVEVAAEQLSPAIIANYVYDLAKEFNQFYHDSPILKEENAELRSMRLALSMQIADIIKSSTGLLGISVPEQM